MGAGAAVLAEPGDAAHRDLAGDQHGREHRAGAGGGLRQGPEPQHGTLPASDAGVPGAAYTPIATWVTQEEAGLHGGGVHCGVLPVPHKEHQHHPSQSGSGLPDQQRWNAWSGSK